MSTDQDSASDDAAARIARLNAKAAKPEPMTVEDLLSLMAVLRDAEHGCDDDCEDSDHDLHGVSLVGTPWMVDVLRNRPLAAG